MKRINERTLHTDVLIIGAGGAGLRAAIAAKSRNVDVLVVSKGVFPEGCNTASAGGMMLAPLSKSDSVQQYIEDTMKAGCGINYPELVKVLAGQAAHRALDLERYGVNYAKSNGEILLAPSPDCTVARGLSGGVPYSGDWFNALVQEVERLGIPVLDHFVVMDLIRTNGAVAGAVGFEAMRETLVSIVSKSVVLATGGAGNLYAFTSNKRGITGDGLVMAYKAGARLSHLEFVQMRQCIIHPEGLRGRLPPFDGFVSSGGRFYNGLHERYMRRYHPDKVEAVTRAEITKCAQLEIMAGRESRHGGVYGDLSDVPIEELMSVQLFMDACRQEHFDPTFQSYEWGPASHHCIGGVIITPDCETGVSGLFAAGEVTAGVQGANRIGGNALTETQVFGAIAGEKAARSVEAAKIRPLACGYADHIKARLLTILNKEGGIDYQEVRSQITALMSRYVGVIRHEDGLRQARTALQAIEAKHIHDLCLTEDRSFRRVAEFLEVENLLMLANITTQAALLRTESRGTHHRQDYPETDPEWEKHLVFRLTPLGAEVEAVPAGIQATTIPQALFL
jgi:fumarate reductase (CoM/CoB) subunit A